MFVWITEGIPTGRTPFTEHERVRPVSSPHGPKPTKPWEKDESPFIGAKAPLGKKPYSSEIEPEKKEIFFARELMSPQVVVLREEHSEKSVSEQFLRLRFRQFPLLDSRNKLVGILSDRDFWKWKSEISELKKADWVQVARKPVLVAKPEAELHFIAKIMLDEKVGCLPVCDETETLIGIITRTDILRALVKFPGISLWI